MWRTRRRCLPQHHAAWAPSSIRPARAARQHWPASPPSDARAAVAPKATALVMLGRVLTPASPMNSAVTFSSVAATAGYGGHAAYAAANAAADALTTAAAAAGLPTTCIQWGAWGSVGMAADRVSADRAASGATLTPVVGAAALEGALATTGLHSPPAVTGAVPRPYWQALVDGGGGGAVPPLLQDVVSKREFVRVAAAAPAAAPTPTPPPPTPTTTDDVTSFLTAAVTDLTGAPPPLSATALAASGVDSLAGVELRRRVASRFGVDTPSGGGRSSHGGQHRGRRGGQGEGGRWQRTAGT